MESKKVLEDSPGQTEIIMKEIGKIIDLKEEELLLTMMEMLEKDYLKIIIMFNKEKFLLTPF